MQPTPVSLAQFFSALTGRGVSVALASESAPKGPQIYGLYSVLPESAPLVVRASLNTLAILAGSLLGLPDDSVLERALQPALHEPLRDAMHEVLNITSTAISRDSRVVFRSMARDLKSLAPEAARAVEQASNRSTYRISIDDSSPELLAILH